MNVSFPQTGIGNGYVQIIIDPSLLAITRQQVVNELGYKGREIPQYFGEIIDDIIAAFPGYCDIKAGYKILDVEPSVDRADGISVGGRFFNFGKTVTMQLTKAKKAAVFTCTIGSGLETWASELYKDGDALKSHFVDIVGSLAAERVTDLLHGSISESMNGLRQSVTNRFSPGYCGWPVSEQQVLFSFFPEGFCGIVISQSSLMIPKKSTSGIIGIGSDVKREPYLCERCSRRDCTYRTYLIEKNKI